MLWSQWYILAHYFCLRALPRVYIVQQFLCGIFLIRHLKKIKPTTITANNKRRTKCNWWIGHYESRIALYSIYDKMKRKRKENEQSQRRNRSPKKTVSIFCCMDRISYATVQFKRKWEEIIVFRRFLSLLGCFFFFLQFYLFISF